MIAIRTLLVIASLWLAIRNVAPGQTEAKTGSIEGTVTFSGTIPKSAVADDAGRHHDLLEVDAATRGLRHVVVYLTRADASKFSGGSMAGTNASSQTLVVDQVDYAFTPRVLAVREGQAVTFKNSDPANHNIRASASNNRNGFNVFTGVDGKYEHRFAVEPQYRPVRFGCDIHPWMRGWLFVFDHPYFGLTDEKGRFTIAAAPAGEYQLHIEQPDIGHRQQRKITIITNETSKADIVVRRDK
jgi:plastocyanin